MSNLSMVEAKLPPGFRFHPRDDELVCDYLMKKWIGSESSLLTEVDLNKCEPWDIPACVGGKEWYFYSQRDRKYATGLRTNRATVSGYWKATGKDRPVVRRGSLVGMRKTLVFYQGRAPKGKKTDWVMHEFRIECPFGPPKLSSSSKEDWVLCRVFFKNKDAPERSDTENDVVSFDENAVSSPPPLMDSFINFDQTPAANPDTNNSNTYQQVPCFSIFSANQNNHHPHNNPNNNNNNNTMFTQNNNNNFHLDPNISTKNHTPTNTLSGYISNHNGVPDHDDHDHDHHAGLVTNNLSSIACDKKVLEAVLCHLTKMETSSAINGSPSLGEAASSESYLSEVGLQQPTMWNNHY